MDDTTPPLDAPKETKKSTKTSLGMDENIEAALAYVLGWVTGLIFFLLEKDNKFVRFHAMQSIILYGGLFVIGLIPLFGVVVNIILWPIAVVLWVILIIMAFQGKWFKLPIIGDIAEKQANK